MTTAHSPDAKSASEANADACGLRYAGVLIALHVAGALKHQWTDRNNLLARMLP